MRKQELVHMHALLAEVATECKRESNLPIDLTEYESQGTKPTSIHERKDAHKGAVFALADAITEACSPEQPARDGNGAVASANAD